MNHQILIRMLLMFIASFLAGPLIPREALGTTVLWGEDWDGDGNDDHFFRKSDHPKNRDMRAEDLDEDGNFEKQWLDNGRDGTFDEFREDADDNGSWDSAYRDSDNDGKIDHVWVDDDGDGEVDDDEWRKIPPGGAIPPPPEPRNPPRPDALDQQFDPAAMVTALPAVKAIGPREMQAQTFTVGLAGTLSQIDVLVSRAPTSGIPLGMLFELRRTTPAGTPDQQTAPIMVQTIPANSIPVSGPGFVGIDVQGAGVSVIPGQSFAIVLAAETTLAGGGNWHGISTNSGDAFSRTKPLSPIAPFGNWTSAPAKLGFRTFVTPPPPPPRPPSVVSQPRSQTVVLGREVTLSVGATGTQPMTYQWRFNGKNIAGATEAVCTLSNVQPSHAGSYSVLVGNTVDSTESANAILVVNPPRPHFTAVSVAGASATIEVQTSRGVLYQLQAADSAGGDQVWRPFETFSGDSTKININVRAVYGKNAFFRVLAGFTLPTVNGRCFSNQTIYRNLTDTVADITVQVTPCEGGTATLFVKVGSDTILEQVEVAGGTTEAVTVRVPGAARIELWCWGNSEAIGCTYTIAGDLAGFSLPTITRKCGSLETIYRNLTDAAANVTVQVTPCEEGGATVLVKIGSDTILEQVDLPGGTTEAPEFTVPKGARIELQCSGDSETTGCTYTIAGR